MEIRSEGHVIQIGRDIAGDCSITSGDVVRRVGDGLGCHGYDSCQTSIIVLCFLHCNSSSPQNSGLSDIDLRHAALPPRHVQTSPHTHMTLAIHIEHAPIITSSSSFCLCSLHPMHCPSGVPHHIHRPIQLRSAPISGLVSSQVFHIRAHTMSSISLLRSAASLSSRHHPKSLELLPPPPLCPPCHLDRYSAPSSMSDWGQSVFKYPVDVETRRSLR